MLAGLAWTSWLLLMAPPLAGLAIILPFYLRNRRSQQRRDPGKGGPGVKRTENGGRKTEETDGGESPGRYSASR